MVAMPSRRSPCWFFVKFGWARIISNQVTMRILLPSFLITLLSTVSALYYIDDADKSITYSSTIGTGYGTKWRKYSEQDNGLAVAVDPNLLFGKTA